MFRALLMVLLPDMCRGGTAASAEVNPEWLTPVDPFRIVGNLYYVGSKDLASYLIVTPTGNIVWLAKIGALTALHALPKRILGTHLRYRSSQYHGPQRALKARIASFPHIRPRDDRGCPISSRARSKDSGGGCRYPCRV